MIFLSVADWNDLVGRQKAMQADIKAVLALLKTIKSEEEQIMSQISDAVGDLATEAAKIANTEDAALIVLNGLKDQLAAALANAADAATAVANVRQVIAGMTAHNDPLASAIATPPAP